MVEFEDLTSEQMPSGLNPERSGAQASFTPTPADLPMVVWLMGTEPWFEEFSLEADQVMQMLGIKRSRLTQIAGRDLRVGRVRRGRYVSPVFRPEDVDRYLAWVRAPASHVKSAGILNEAADALKTQSEELERQFAALRSDVVQDFADVVAKSAQDTHSLYASLASELQRGFRHVADKLTARLEFMQRRQDELAGRMSSHEAVLEKLQAGQMLLLKALQEQQVRSVDEMTRQMQDLQAAIGGTVRAGLLDVNEALSAALSNVESTTSLTNRRRTVSPRRQAKLLASMNAPLQHAEGRTPIKTRARLMRRAGMRNQNESK